MCKLAEWLPDIFFDFYLMLIKDFNPNDPRYIAFTLDKKDKENLITLDNFELEFKQNISESNSIIFKHINVKNKINPHLDLIHIFNRPKNKNIFRVINNDSYIVINGYCDPEFKKLARAKIDSLNT